MNLLCRLFDHRWQKWELTKVSTITQHHKRECSRCHSTHEQQFVELASGTGVELSERMNGLCFNIKTVAFLPNIDKECVLQQ